MTYKPLAPDYIQFYPTTRCDRDCGFCFNQSLPEVEDMPLGAFRKMVDRLSSAGVLFIDIIGGEPTLHRDLLPMIEHACQKGMGINLSSNGRDPDQLSEVLRRFPRVTVGVSVNDHETLRHVERFLKKHRPVVKTVMGRTVDHGLIEQIIALSPRRYYLLYRDALGPDGLKEAQPFDQFLDEVRQRYGSRVDTVYCAGFLADDERTPVLRTTRCSAGSTKLGILPDGSVYPCNLLFGRKEFRLGNILNDPFDRIWSHGSLASFRTFQKNSCPRRSCRLHGKCHGGCPAHGIWLHGEPSAPDQRCLSS